MYLSVGDLFETVMKLLYSGTLILGLTIISGAQTASAAPSCYLRVTVTEDRTSDIVSFTLKEVRPMKGEFRFEVPKSHEATPADYYFIAKGSSERRYPLWTGAFTIADIEEPDRPASSQLNEHSITDLRITIPYDAALHTLIVRTGEQDFSFPIDAEEYACE